MTPISLSLSDGSSGECTLTNKRGVWTAKVPGTILVRKSDDGLRYEVTTEDGRKAAGMIESTMGAKIVASAVFIDFGIVDAITDKHRKYPASFVVPIERPDANSIETEDLTRESSKEDKYEKLKRLAVLRVDGVLTEEEFEVEKQKILNADN